MKSLKIIVFFFIISSSLFAQEVIIKSNNSFLPEAGKYIVSGWVKENHPQQVITYQSYITLNITDLTVLVNENFSPQGNIIDGWQRIIGIVEIPDLSNTIATLNIELNCNNSSGGACYFDDIRFYPFNGNMKSFVYDEATQRLMAELDENNYATFYEYDQEGGLIRVKKETERGVYTIQETRSNTIKRND